MNQQNGYGFHQKYWPALVALLLVVAIFMFLSRSSAAHGPRDHEQEMVVQDVTDRIIQLADESQTQNQECRRFLNRIQSMASGSEKKEYFVSQTSAIAVLKEAGRYPGTPLATTEALDQFLSLPSFPQGEKLMDLKFALNRLSDCYSIEYYGVLTRLMDPRTQAYFTRVQRMSEQYLVLRYIQRETISTPKFFVQFEKLVDLFDRSIHEGLIIPQPETRVTIENVKWELSKIKSEGALRFKKIEESKSSFSQHPMLQADALEGLSWQLTQTEDLQDDLSDVVEMELENLIEPQEIKLSKL